MSTSNPFRFRNAATGSRNRGSALVIVILVVLVLTVVGLGIAFFATTEDRTSGNVRMSRVGFYAAEAGLREAESVVSIYAATNSGVVNALLTATSDDDKYQPPGGGYEAFLLKTGGKTYRDIVLDQPLGDANQRGMYTVYVRNNADDPGGKALDQDQRINIVVVGQMVLVDSAGNPIRDSVGNPTIGIRKVLEEQIMTNPEGSAAATQKGSNVGGTSAGVK